MNNNKNNVNINFNDGSEDFRVININGDPKRSFRWNPKDVNFFDKFYMLVMWLQTDFTEMVGKLAETDIKLDDNGMLRSSGYEAGAIIKMGEEVANRIDSTFGVGTSKAAFQDMNPLTPTTSGTIFENLMTALAPVIEDSFKDSGMNVNEMNAKKQEYAAKTHVRKKYQSQNQNRKHNK